MQEVQEVLNVKNINVDITGNSSLYSLIRGYWKDSTREELVAKLVQKLSLAEQNPGRIHANISSILKALPPDWRDESSAIASMLRDQLSF